MSYGVGVDQRLAAIKSSTKGVLFAGTPHRGANKKEWAATATKLAWYIKKHHSNVVPDTSVVPDASVVLDALKRGSDVLERLQYDFEDILGHFAIFTLIEDIEYEKIGKIVEKNSAIIGWQHEKQIYIHANHSDMVKYAKNTENYDKVRDAIHEIMRDRIERARPIPVDFADSLDLTTYYLK